MQYLCTAQSSALSEELCTCCCRCWCCCQKLPDWDLARLAVIDRWVQSCTGFLQKIWSKGELFTVWEHWYSMLNVGHLGR
mmetsp:Transcript_47236/g.119612  ORF Transcript_47236/g.119612 Transcript_47236/m.119612 type:complete len:80 (-) Transcript_47236:29-268(-)